MKKAKALDENTLGGRMKHHEHRFRTVLPSKSNFILRIDGKAFHTYTKGLQKPFDDGLMEDMVETTKYLCEKIQGAKLGYTQSDEISILFTDYDTAKTSLWFDGQIQKIVSVAASLATSKFNQLRTKRWLWKEMPAYGPDASRDEYDELLNERLAEFDARVFVIEESPEEVVNYFIWRQRDAIKNSVSALAQANFSHKALHGMNGTQMQDMLLEKGIDWNDLGIPKQRGWCTVKKTELWVKPKDGKLFEPHKVPTVPYVLESDEVILDSHAALASITVKAKWQELQCTDDFYERSKWVIDDNIPVFADLRDYVLMRLPESN